jgi:endonuclease/exonuclease/phosphatase family metal-dependent hydrolase
MQIRRDFLRVLEVTIVGIFMVQSIRFLYAALFADVSSADLVQRISDRSTIQHLPGYVDPATVQTEIYAVVAVFLAPLLGLVIARTRWSLPLAVAVTVIARYLVLELPDSDALAAAVVVAGGLLYLTLIAIRRPRFLPALIAIGVAGDQIIRALHSTADPTFDPDYQFTLGTLEVDISTAVAAIAVFGLLLTALTTLIEREEERLPGYVRQPAGVLSGWGALALGGILYLQFTVLGLPNAVARWANMDYQIILPMILLATVLPLVPEVRAQAGNFLSLFDGIYRGWLWALLLVLFIVIGKRFEGLAAGITLSLAQFLAILTLWWLVKQPEGRRLVNPTPILILVSAIVFFLLTVGDYFTYDYAYVRPMAAPFQFVSDLLSGMRGMGLPLAIVAVILTCMPMILERQIIPWRQGRVLETILTLLVVIIVTVTASRSAVSAPIRRPLIPDCLRIATYNIHGGFTQYFAPNLELLVDTINRSGADVVLLQEVETGRLSSGSVDQAVWLADHLNMNQVFFPQNEELQGLAILSRLDVDEATGALLTSPGAQAAVQYVTYPLDNNGDLHVYNVWLSLLLEERDGQPVPQQAQDQTLQAEEVERLVSSNHFNANAGGRDRVVLGGTFNHDETSPLYSIWTKWLFQDPFTGLFDEKRDTFFRADGVSARFDYIWLLNLVPSGINIDLENQASDHRPSILAVGRQAGQSCPG